MGLVFCLALLTGLLFPVQWDGITTMLVPLMIFLLFLSFLGVDLSQITVEIKRPWPLLLQVALQFILLPVILFYLAQLAGFSTYAIAIFLLACMPAGLGSPVFTSIAGGRTASSAILSVVTHAIVPLTVPFLFWLVAGTHVEVNIMAMVQKLAILVGAPAVLAWFFRTQLPSVVTVSQPNRKLLSILALAGVAYVVIAPFASAIWQDVMSIIPTLLAMYAFFAILCVFSAVLSYWHKPEEQIAIVISRIYMNNALGITLAVQFLDQDVVLMTILSEIPWFTTFGMYLWFQKQFIQRNR